MDTPKTPLFSGPMHLVLAERRQQQAEGEANLKAERLRVEDETAAGIFAAFKSWFEEIEANILADGLKLTGYVNIGRAPVGTIGRGEQYRLKIAALFQNAEASAIKVLIPVMIEPYRENEPGKGFSYSIPTTTAYTVEIDPHAYDAVTPEDYISFAGYLLTAAEKLTFGFGGLSSTEAPAYLQPFAAAAFVALTRLFGYPAFGYDEGPITEAEFIIEPDTLDIATCFPAAPFGTFLFMYSVGRKHESPAIMPLIYDALAEAGGPVVGLWPVQSTTVPISSVERLLSPDTSQTAPNLLADLRAYFERAGSEPAPTPRLYVPLALGVTTAAQDYAYHFVNAEVQKITAKFRPYASEHELLGVLDEEFDEFKNAIHLNSPDMQAAELRQVAAVAIRGLFQLYAQNMPKVLWLSGFDWNEVVK